MMRPPEQVMNLARMGSSFQTRLSFMNTLIRRMARENWRFERLRCEINDAGYGVSIYAAHTPKRTYSLIAFTSEIAPEQRTDRVVAEVWDATFSLFDGVPTEMDLERLAANTPKQEAGRFQPSELVLSRANKSLRLFEHVVSSLAEGRQPDIELLASVGYLMRTTAVYGSGKFGCADRGKIAIRPESQGAFQIEMLTVYLIRWFTIELVEHIARNRGGSAAVSLAPKLRSFLGIGNATGLGMAPFLIHHPVLIHNWVLARETALARVRGLESLMLGTQAHFRRILAQATRHIGEWEVEDEAQTIRIRKLREDLKALLDWSENEKNFAPSHPWDRLYRYAEANFSAEGQELLVSLLLEPHGDLIDELADTLHTSTKQQLEPEMSVPRLQELIEELYRWALEIDFDDPEAQRRFWYYSEDKLEPRFGDRYADPGAKWEMPLVAGRDVAMLARELQNVSGDTSVGRFVLTRPEFRHIVRRIQTIARFPYAEIRDNLVDAKTRPIDLLRFKLAFFGASKFDPKSDLWTRVTLYQGAPLPDQLVGSNHDGWAFTVKPSKEADDVS